MLRGSRPEAAKQAAAAVRANEAARLAREIRHLFAPHSAAAAFVRYWEKLIEGDEAGAHRLLRECAELGAPLPFEPR